MAKHERYIISEEEVALLDKYEGKTEKNYEMYSAEALAVFCRLKDRSNDLFIRRYQAAREVIDGIAKEVGIDPNHTSFWLYAPNEDGGNHIIDKINDFFSRSGEKVKLKKRIDELEKENAILRSLIHG